MDCFKDFAVVEANLEIQTLVFELWEIEDHPMADWDPVPHRHGVPNAEFACFAQVHCVSFAAPGEARAAIRSKEQAAVVARIALQVAG